MRVDRPRIDRLRGLMKKANLDVLLLQLPENVCYTSDYWPLLGLTLVFLPLDGEPTLLHSNFETEPETWISDVRRFTAESTTMVADPLKNAGRIIGDLLDGGRASVGYEGSFSSIGTGYLKYRANTVTPGTIDAFGKSARKARWVDATELIYNSRMIKTEKEIEKLRIANKVSEIGLGTLYNGMKDGRSEIDLASEIEKRTVVEGTGLKGAQHVMACAFLSSGEFTADTYGVCFGNRTRKMKRGDFVMLEFDVVVDGYSSDMSRTYVIGTPSARQRELLHTVHQAQVEGVNMEKDGLPAREVCRQADKILTKGGYGEYVRHYFGHGIGVTIWEPKPYVHSASRDVLRAGMVHSAEPGAYLPHFGGVRIEDNVYLGHDGPEYLSTYMPVQE
jgi:Xaa-Pro aminopeptidase